MSYDLMIRSDDLRSRSHSREHVRDIVAAILHVPVGERQAILRDPARNHYMEIDFALCDEEGNSLLRRGAPDPGVCNQLELHVPYAHIAGNGTDDAPYFYVGHAIAAALGWRLYDAQEDRYLDPSAPHPTPRQI